MFAGFNIMFPENARFFQKFKCYSVSMLPGNERQDVEKGGKIIMPPSALDQLTRLNVVYPMLFKLTNNKKNRITHAGVLEFVADEGKVYLPYWMMRNLLLDEGDLLQIENISLPVATFSKFQPQSIDFLDITNPKAVLENALRYFSCLTAGDSIAIKYNQRIYELCVLETRPGNAVSIIECDMNVEFEAPVGYKDPKTEEKQKSLKGCDEVVEQIEEYTKLTFRGEGVRLDGKKKKNEVQTIKFTSTKKLQIRGVPDYNYVRGLIMFNRSIKPISDRIIDSMEKIESGNENRFTGIGFSLKGKK